MPATTMHTFVTFILEEIEFGIDILKQREVLRNMPITRVPKASICLEGVVNLRGSVVPVFNMRKLFSMPPVCATKNTRILCIEGQCGRAGLLVDRVGPIRYDVPDDRVQPPPAVVASLDSFYFSGIAMFDDSLLAILDLEKLLPRTREKSEDQL